MFTYSQTTGELRNASGALVCIGFSGHGIDYINKPAFQYVKNLGCIPAGKYKMVGWLDQSPRMGAGVIVLKAEMTDAEMHDRCGFAIHGLAISNPLASSEGCICIGTTVIRKLIWDSGDHDLLVTP